MLLHKHENRWFILTVLILCLTTKIFAQSTCDANVTSVLDSVKAVCATTDRDRVCYGNISVQAIPQTAGFMLNFERPGDQIDVTDVKSLQLSPMDLINGNWGIARLRLVPTTAKTIDDDLVLLFFGDVKVEDQSIPRYTFDFTLTTPYDLNLRSFPSVESTAIDWITPGSTVRALGRLADSSWVRVQKQPIGTVGWVNREVLQAEDLSKIDNLIVEGTHDPYYGAMQAFTFQSGDSSGADCTAILDGLLIQTPEGVTRVSILINEVIFDFVNTTGAGTTAFIEAQPNNDMRMSLLEGAAYVGTGGVQQYVPAGTQVTVPLDGSLSPTAPPSLPIANNPSEVQALYNGLGHTPTYIVWQPSSMTTNTTQTGTTTGTNVGTAQTGTTTGTSTNTTQTGTTTGTNVGTAQTGTTTGTSTNTTQTGGTVVNPTPTATGVNKHGCDGKGNSCNAPGHN